MLRILRFLIWLFARIVLSLRYPIRVHCLGELQQLVPERKARNADEIHDLLRRLGDLSADEIAARSTEAPQLDGLLAQRRIARVRIAGQERYILSYFRLSWQLV